MMTLTARTQTEPRRTATTRAKRSLATLLLAVMFTVVNSGNAWADHWIVVHHNFTSYITCMSRGADMGATGQYYSPYCTDNDETGDYPPGRYTLHIVIKTTGGMSPTP